MTNMPWVKNIKALRHRDRKLANLIETACPSTWSYGTIASVKGPLSLAMKNGDKTVSIHSRYDPIREAQMQRKAFDMWNPRLVMVLGVGLAYHLRALLHPKTFRTIIVERDPYALKLAMEKIDLSDILESDKFDWLIGIESYSKIYDFITKASLPLQILFKTLTVFRHPNLNKIHGEYFDAFLRCFRDAAHRIVFSYGNSPKDSLIGVRNIITNFDVIAKNPGIKDLFGKFNKIPGIIVSSGPSLDGNIEELKKAVGKAVIISADSTFKILMQHGIKPDMVSALEREIQIAGLFETLPPEWFKDVYLAGCPVLMPEVYKAWKGPTIIVYREFAHFDWLKIPKGKVMSGPSCSNMAFKILAKLGCDPIILVGQDCSFKSLAKTHAEGSNAASLNLTEEKTFNVKGNYEDFVATDAIYNMFRICFENDVASYKGACINATEGGAWIAGTRLMPLSSSISQYCVSPVNFKADTERLLKIPTDEEVGRARSEFERTVSLTREEVISIIRFCNTGMKSDNLNQMIQQRAKIIMSEPYLGLYLMHIVQMNLVKFEMDLIELTDDEESQKILTFQNWFKSLGHLCKLALEELK